MDTETFLLELDEAMQKAADFVSSEMSSIRTGKASPALLDNINVHVEAYDVHVGAEIRADCVPAFPASHIEHPIAALQRKHNQGNR